MAENHDHEQLWEELARKSESELLSETDAGLDMHQMIVEGEARHMGAEDILSFREAIAQSQGCDVKNVTYQYDAIIDDDGKMLLNELFLVFRVKSFNAGILTNRQVHRIRVAVPQDVQQRARSMIKASCAHASKPVASPSPARAPSSKTGR